MKIPIQDIDKHLKKKFGTWTKFCAIYGHDNKNFKRKLLANITKLNNWLEPVGIEIQFILKKKT